MNESVTMDGVIVSTGITDVPNFEKAADPINEIFVRYHRELFPDLPDISVKEYGNGIDLYCAEETVLKAGDFAYVNLGVSIKLPEGYYAILMPRSSTFGKYGIIQTNGIGLIDETYQGDNDVWKMPVLAMRDTVIPKNERIAQFIIYKSERVSLTEVNFLDGKDRGGFGSTGRK